MKKIQILLSIFILTISFSCTNEEELPNIDALKSPENLSALFTISQDNTGNVTILPKGEGVSQFEVFYGDGTLVPAIVNPGTKTNHVYPEGTYQVKIVGVTLNGKKSEVILPLTVSYQAPTDLEVIVGNISGNNLGITVAAAANLETFFQVYFGDVADEVPTSFMEGDIIPHTYPSVGSYQLTVVALSGGIATTEFTQTVTITDPLLLPLNFESTTLNYAFTNFGGATTTIINNPDIGDGNSSLKVARLTKGNGSETWAGSFIELSTPIDFSTLKKIKMKVWSPQAGIVVKMKLENSANANINAEVDVTNSVANGWQELTFDFSAINTANTYQKVVVFFNFGVSGAGQNYYFDDIQLTSGIETVGLPLNFESPNLTYTFVDFGGNNMSVINNPDASGINTSSKVGRSQKNAGSETWGGSFIDMAAPINFSVLKKIKVKVWSPQVGIPIKLKLEKIGDSNVNTELDATTTVANAWEELTYDFTGIVNANNYQRVVLFFNFGVSGGTPFYFDDIRQSN